MQSVSTSYIFKAPQPPGIAFHSSSYFYINLVRNLTQLKKINTFIFENNAFLSVLAQIFDILKI